MKKTIITIFLSIMSCNVMADNRVYVEPKDSVEYHIHNENLFSFKVNDVYDDKPIKVIKYLNEEWLLVSNDGSATYYIQVDPIYKTISRVKILYPFDEIRMGKEMKFLEDKYGQIRDTGAKYLMIEEKDLRIRMSTDFDNIGKDFNKIYSIFDFIETKTQIKRKESINKLYYEERMIRK